MAETYALIRGFLGQVLRAAGDAIEGETRTSAEVLAAAKADIDWHDAHARRAHLGELVGVARAVLAAVEGSEDPAVAEAADLLGRVVDQDVTVGDDGEPQVRDGVARDRIVSHSDPEMRHGRKSASRRFDGHKLDVMSDEGSELVLGVDVRPGNAADGEGAAPLLGEAQGVDGIEVETLVGDMAYSDGDVREAVERGGAEMVAKVPPVTNGGRLPKTDFDIDTAEGSVTCPAGQTTTDARAAKDHKGRPATRFVFPASACGPCPLQERCVGGKGGRTIVVGVHEERIAAARRAQAHDPAVIALLRARAKVERKIDHLQDLGMRKARYRGRRKTKLQALLAATVANFKRLAVLGALGNSPALPTAG